MRRAQTRSMRGVNFKVTFVHGKIAGPPTVVNILSPDTNTWLNDFNTRMNTARNNYLDLLGPYNTNNDLMVPAIKELKEYNADYFEVFIRGNRRGYFPNSDRAKIGLNDTNNQTPPMGNYPEIIDTGLLVVNGDALRVASGSHAMALPTIIEVTAKYTAANGYFLENSDQSIALSAAAVIYEALLPEGILLCNKMDNEIETHFDNGNKATMRHNSGFWGVHYVSPTPIGYLDLTCLHFVTHAAMEHVDLMAMPGEEVGETNVQGFSRMNIHTFGPIILEVRFPGFLPQDIAFERVEGLTIVRTIFLTPVPPPPPVV